MWLLGALSVGQGSASKGIYLTYGIRIRRQENGYEKEAEDSLWDPPEE